jgi:hypothetical protein
MHASKIFPLLFIVTIAASSFVIFQSANAQTVPKPSVPEFTLSYVDNSRDIAPTYDVDTYTGKTVMTHEGYHVQSISVTMTIKNQVFNQYTDNNDHAVRLYYKIGSKGHFGNTWTNYSVYYIQVNGDFSSRYLEPSNDLTTTVTFGLSGNNDSAHFDINVPLKNEGQIDFRILSYTAYYVVVKDEPNPFNIRYPYHDEYTIVEESAWSTVQVLDIPSGITSYSPTSEPTQIPNQTPTTRAMPTTSSTSTLNAPNTTINLIPIPLIFLGVFVLGVVVGILLLRLPKRRSTSAPLLSDSS